MMQLQYLGSYLKHIQSTIPVWTIVWTIASDLPSRYQEPLQKLGVMMTQLEILKKTKCNQE